MKKTLMVGVIFLALTAGALPRAATATEGEEPPMMTEDEFIELVRGALKRDRVQLITQAMNFSAEEAAAFWPIYKDYEAEFTEIGDERLALIGEYAESYAQMTDDKAGELARGSLALEERRTALKRECFEKIEEEMSSVLAARFLQVENQINLLLDLQISQQLPLIADSE